MSLMEHLATVGVKKIVEKVLDQRGVDLRHYKSTFLRRRLDARLRARGVHDYIQYGLLLDKDPSEYQALFESLSINVTEFFRDRDVFERFSTHIISKLLADARRQREIRVWSAGCATGEETYTIAIQLHEAAEHLNGHTFKIIGTDMNANAISAAKLGRYHISLLKNVSKYLLLKYFHPSSETEFYEVRKEIKESVGFNIGELTTLASPRSLDVIFCRNVLMYLEREVRNSILMKFYHALKPTGFLILGKAEAIIGQPSEFFESIMPKERIYKKR